jgi:hypothetical protein
MIILVEVGFAICCDNVTKIRSGSCHYIDKTTISLQSLTSANSASSSHPLFTFISQGVGFGVQFCMPNFAKNFSKYLDWFIAIVSPSQVNSTCSMPRNHGAFSNPRSWQHSSWPDTRTAVSNVKNRHENVFADPGFHSPLVGGLRG